MRYKREVCRIGHYFYAKVVVIITESFVSNIFKLKFDVALERATYN